MPFDSVVVAAVAAELRREASDAQVVKVYQPSPLEVLLHLRAGGRRLLWLVSADPQAFRCHFVSAAPPNPPEPPQFCMVLRKHLEGARLIAVEQNGLERVVTLRFLRSDGERLLHAEMMGKHSNLVLVDDGGLILDCLKHVSARFNRVRELLPTRRYLPPPPTPKPDPLLAAPEEVRAALDGVASLAPSALVKRLGNVGPFFAAEALARAVSPRPDDVADALLALMEDVRQERFTPTVLLNATGEPTDAWAFDCRTLPPDRQDPAPAMSLALEAARGVGERVTPLEELRDEVRARLEATLERERRRMREIQAGLDHALAADDLRVKGELLQANAHALERGAESAALPNFYEADMAPLTIALDPTLSARENAEAYFRRHRKAKASEPILRERLHEAERHIAEGERLLDALPGADRETLERLAGDLAPHAAPGSETTSEESRRPAPGVRRTVSSDGWEIWYGENQQGNDTLTSRLASPTDWWLHVRAAASAHVVIRTAKRPEAVPQRTLVEAARIAAAHSESKHSGVTPVDYTLKKYVRKPRGAGPGKALYTHEKTLHIEPEE